MQAEALPKLTTRQAEVCDLLCAGRSNKEIAAILGLSHRTVEDHRGAIYTKYGVNNAVQLVRVIFSGGYR